MVNFACKKSIGNIKKKKKTELWSVRLSSTMGKCLKSQKDGKVEIVTFACKKLLKNIGRVGNVEGRIIP